MNHDFKIRFNHNRQWATVYLHNVHPNTFYRKGGGRWGWFAPAWTNPKVGLFGELHFVKRRLRFDGIVHELDHLRTAWMWARGETITRKNEERYATLLDELCRKFIRELRKIEPDIKL